MTDEAKDWKIFTFPTDGRDHSLSSGRMTIDFKAGEAREDGGDNYPLLDSLRQGEHVHFFRVCEAGGSNDILLWFGDREIKLRCHAGDERHFANLGDMDKAHLEGDGGAIQFSIEASTRHAMLNSGHSLNKKRVSTFIRMH